MWDAVLLFNPPQIDGRFADVAAISIKEPAKLGQNHGVFVSDKK